MMIHAARIVLVFALAGGASAQASASAAIQKCKKALSVKPPEFKLRLVVTDPIPVVLVHDWSEPRLEALKALRPFHGVAVAKALFKFSETIERDLIRVDSKRGKLKKAIASGFKAIQKAQKNKGGAFSMATPGARKYIANTEEAGYYRAIRDAEEALSAEILKQSESFDADAARLALKSLVGNARQPLSLKIAATRRAASFGAEMLKPLSDALSRAIGRAHQPAETAAVVEGIGSMGPAARPFADQLLVLLSHIDGGVRERAALALSRIAVPGAIEPMIALLAKERGVAQKRIAAALEVLTRKQFGIRVSAWQRWFAAEGAPYAAGAKELGGGKPSSADEYNKKNYYYGIPQDGKSILYILDCSGSMVVSFKNPKFAKLANGQEQPIPAGGSQVSRMDACKQRLSEALGRLTSEQRFNIITYSVEPKLYKKGMQAATKKNIQAAQNFLKRLRADGATNIYDTMQLAFAATGRGSYDKAYGIDCDMMFLLTDGKPTLAGTSDGYDLVENILVGVRKWNALQRVVVNTIGIGKKLNGSFLRKLAEENGGQFRNDEGSAESGNKGSGAGKDEAPLAGGRR